MKLCGSLLLIQMLAIPLLGHHSVAASYDANKPITMQGIITKIQFMNPHTWMDLEVRNSNGSVTSWRVEIGGPSALAKVGLDKSLFDLSKPYTLEVWPAFDGGNHVAGRKLTFADGRTFDVSDKWGMLPPAGPVAK